VANGEHDPGFLHRRHDPPARRLVRRHRLFQQDVITEPGEYFGWLGVHAILRADKDCVGEPAPVGQLSPVGGRVLGGDACSAANRARRTSRGSATATTDARSG
jgi:hypothetical protein